MPQVYGEKWRVQETLNEGGQAHTFLVYDLNDPTKAIYVLKRLKNLKRIPRFRQEIEACLALDHNNILKIKDQELTSDRPYFVAEYCSRGALATHIISTFSTLDRLRLFLAICRGVGFAHEKKIIHRDLKPENIFLREDFTPVVGDFGLCFIDEDGERVTMTEEQVGSRFYMSPELASGRNDDVTPAADVYSLGKILYWLSAGRVFDREAHRSARFDLTKNQTAPDYFHIYSVLDKTIAEDPVTRFQNATQLGDAVEQVIKLIERRAHVLDLNVPQECSYCGIGIYKVVADSMSTDDRSGSTDVYSFGFTLVGMPLWLIMVCDHCANVQIFRPDYGKTNPWINR